MSGSRKIAVVGSGDFADSIVAALRHSPVHALAGVSASGDSLPEGASMVLDLVSGSRQASTLRQLASNDLPIATLPLATGDNAAREALGSGRVVQVNPLRGFMALEAFRTDVRGGKAGKPYGIFAAHRVKQGHADLFESIGVPLLHFTFDLFDEQLVRVQTTKANLFGRDGDAWFVIARGSNDLIVTIEFAASLAVGAPADQQILLEATGNGRHAARRTDATGHSGIRKIGWHA